MYASPVFCLLWDLKPWMSGTPIFTSPNISKGKLFLRRVPMCASLFCAITPAQRSKCGTGSTHCQKQSSISIDHLFFQWSTPLRLKDSTGEKRCSSSNSRHGKLKLKPWSRTLPRYVLKLTFVTIDSSISVKPINRHSPRFIQITPTSLLTFVTKKVIPLLSACISDYGIELASSSLQSEQSGTVGPCGIRQREACSPM